MKQYITLTQYHQQERRIRHLRTLGIKLMYRKSRIKVLMGIGAIIIAIIPNGLGFIFYPLGVTLLSSGGIDIYAVSKVYKQKIRFAMWRLRR